ncbi:MAG: hypothetical protein WCA49_19335 [Candidatus Sulfotelmatobacter sp.]
MKTNPDYPQCHEDRKAQKLLDALNSHVELGGLFSWYVASEPFRLHQAAAGQYTSD